MIKTPDFDCPTVKRLSLFIERKRKYEEDIYKQRILVIRKLVPHKVGDIIKGSRDRDMRITMMELKNHATHGFEVVITGHLVVDGDNHSKHTMRISKPLKEFVDES